MPPAIAVELDDDALCTEAAAAMVAASPLEAAIAAICWAALAASLPPPLCVVTSMLRISSTVANWLTVRTR